MISKLIPTDWEMFTRLCITPKLLERAAVCRVGDSEARERYGIGGVGDGGSRQDHAAAGRRESRI
jgi:hypothetical protein